MKTINLKNLLLPGLLVGLVFSCTNSRIHKGNRYYDADAYAKAITYYEKVYEKKPSKDIGLKLAESYAKTGNYTEAERVYTDVIQESSPGDKSVLEYARMLMANDNYDDAEVQLNNYLAQNQNDNMAQMLLQACKSIDDRYIDTTLFVLEPLELEGFTNTFSVMEYGKGIAFIGDKISSKRKTTNPWTGDSYLDIYTTEMQKDSSWSNPELLLGELNGPYHEGPASFTKNGKTVYFTRSNYTEKKLEVNDKQENNLKIFKASLENGEWTNLESLPFNSDDYSTAHPALSPDGKTMYFISDMPGGLGGTDLYVTKLVNGSWSQPENLGEPLNTPGNEMFPFFDEDGTLYFSSTAHNSMGGLDVFKTVKDGDKWSTPENMNYPINSDKDDFGFLINQETKTGYLSSSRSNQDVIYQFKQYAPTFNLFGHVQFKESKKPVADALVSVVNKRTRDTISTTTDENGDFHVQLEEDAEYDIISRKHGAFTTTESVSTVGFKYSEDFEVLLEMEEIIINKPIVLKNINYDFDKFNIRPDAAKILDSLVVILEQNPNITIEMGSHTDVRGKSGYNLYLSKKRAESAVNYLISQGIDPKRLTWAGYGEMLQINMCIEGVYCTDQQHEENRRTEFKVTSQ